MSIQTIKNKVIDKVSDVMSYPARRNAQKSILNSNANTTALKNRSASDKKNFSYSLENKGGLGGMPNSELIAQRRAISVPKGWDAKTYNSFKTANPKLEPNAEDTARMNGTYKVKPQLSQPEQMRRTLDSNRKKGIYSNGIGVGK